MKHDAELVAWLAENGLTLAEAAWIQPSYDGCELGYCPTPVPVSSGYKNATAVAIGADVVTVALSVAPLALSRPLTGGLGLATGVIGIAIGAPNFDASGSRRTLGFVNAGVGTASAALGVYRLAHRSRTQSRLSFGPWLDGRGGAGSSAQVTF